MKKKYDHKEIEKRWQKEWSERGVYCLKKMDTTNNTFYNLWMFPYPSAEGLHAGHAFASTGSDIYGRYMRMKGKKVFQPIGYDSFGMHSENFALKIKEHPKEMLDRTTANYERQMRSLGHGYDWTRTVTTSDIDYYRWTQWIFFQMFINGLAYRKKSAVNWCPSCKTVLADEQVVTPAQAGKAPPGYKSLDTVPDGIRVCERCGDIVQEKELEQWMFRITEYAERLIDNLKKIDWPESIKTAQINWIGKKEGIDITYDVDKSGEKVTCWTSRPDTNFGATFVVLAPEHPLAKKITISKYKDKVTKYIQLALKKNKEDRIAESRKKTGVFTGAFAVNNLNGKKMPIWVSDFVLGDVGTGAVVGVPGHDKRDFEFAVEHKLEIIRVVVGKDKDETPVERIEQVQEDEGEMINSDFLDGMDIHNATETMMDYMEEKGWGKRTVNYHLRDWIISRQRYWGPPIPMVYCNSCAKRGKSWFTENKKKLIHEDQSDWEHVGWYPEENLPVELPHIDKYEPEGAGKGPLAKKRDFIETKCPNCGSKAERETDVSDTFLDSAWYFLRYPSVDAKSSINMPFDTFITKKWLPVDLYFGGAEHAVLHLMYARFVTMALSDMRFIDFEEPFPHFFAHGLMIKDGAKMSKSRGNVVNPDEYINKFGADTLRLYLMFMGPMDGYPDFRDTGIEGMRRFVERVWDIYTKYGDMVIEGEEKVNKLLYKMHHTIKKVTNDVKEFKYNTAIASMMEYVNLLRELAISSKKGQEASSEWKLALNNLILLLAPFAPYMSEEVWTQVLGNKFTIHKQKWPKYNKEFLIEDVVNIIIQVNGKLRANIPFTATDVGSKEKIIKTAKQHLKISKWLENGVQKTVFIPGKLVNFVTK